VGVQQPLGRHLLRPRARGRAGRAGAAGLLGDRSLRGLAGRGTQRRLAGGPLGVGGGAQQRAGGGCTALRAGLHIDLRRAGLRQGLPRGVGGGRGGGVSRSARTVRAAVSTRCAVCRTTVSGLAAAAPSIEDAHPAT
jgi:hypothetical protein